MVGKTGQRRIVNAYLEQQKIVGERRGQLHPKRTWHLKEDSIWYLNKNIFTLIFFFHL